MDALQRIVVDPRYRDYLAIVKGARNGFVYGVKVRFPHALLMAFLFGRGNWKTRLSKIFSMTRQHSTRLASFVAIYKTLLLAARRLRPSGKQIPQDAFLSGCLAGYMIFGESNAINEQVTLYVASRVMAAFMPRASKVSPKGPGSPVAPDPRWFAALASVAWGGALYFFNHHGERVQPGMYSSMRYIYWDSEKWDGLHTLLWYNT